MCLGDAVLAVAREYRLSAGLIGREQPEIPSVVHLGRTRLDQAALAVEIQQLDLPALAGFDPDAPGRQPSAGQDFPHFSGFRTVHGDTQAAADAPASMPSEAAEAAGGSGAAMVVVGALLAALALI
jgi:hypothetical protein